MLHDFMPCFSVSSLHPQPPLHKKDVRRMCNRIYAHTPHVVLELYSICLTISNGLLAAPVLFSTAYFCAMATAVASATSIMAVKVLCRAAASSSSPVTMWSEMVHSASARLPR